MPRLRGDDPLKEVPAVPGDRIRLVDGLTHCCSYVSFNDYVHFACGGHCPINSFHGCRMNKGPVTCVECAARS